MSTGYDRLRFPRKLPLELLCPLCSEVFNNPVQCTKCKQNYCSYCINQAQKSCHECQHDLAEVSKFLIDKLNNLEIKCRYWYNGCDKIAKIPQIASHEKKCEKIPEKEFNDQEDLLFECPQGCQKLCTLPEIKGKHNCVCHLQEKIIGLDEKYGHLFKENVELGKENDEIENALDQKHKELVQLKEKERELVKILTQMQAERDEKVAELSKYTIENMEDTYMRIQENFGDNLLKYPYTKSQNEEAFNEFSRTLTEEMNEMLKKGQKEHKEMFDSLKKNLMKNLSN